MIHMSKHKSFPRGFCVFPGYRYCGPGCSGPGAPINDVDAACRIHDLCYQRYGQSCYCDLTLIKNVKPKINVYTKKGRQALLLYLYMNLQIRFTCTHLNYPKKYS